MDQNNRRTHFVRVVDFQGGERLEAGLNRMIHEEESKSSAGTWIQFKELTTFSSEYVLVFEVTIVA